MQASLPSRPRSAIAICAALLAIAPASPAGAADATISAAGAASLVVKLPPAIARVEVLAARESRMPLPTEMMRNYRVPDDRARLAVLNLLGPAESCSTPPSWPPPQVSRYGTRPPAPRRPHRITPSSKCR